jgi:hypothetical protein
MKGKERIVHLVDKLIRDGEDLCKNPWADRQHEHLGVITHYVDLEGFKKFISSFRLLLSLLGHLGKPWQDIYEESKKGNRVENAMSVVGSLKSIKESLDDGLLIGFEDMVYAEAFSNLVEQAEYLYEQGYFLASGVVLRAVLEERLKKLCEQNECLPGKARPTINDYNQNLYAAKTYDKITFKHVDSMAAVGNAAAHNDAQLDRQEVARFLRDLPQFLLRFAT